MTTTFSVVGKGAPGAPMVPAPVTVAFPENLKIEMPDIPPPIIHFKPEFKPDFQPQNVVNFEPEFKPLNVFKPEITVNVPENGPLFVNASLHVPWLKLAAILFANTLFFAMVHNIINFFLAAYFDIRD